jgi:hypothetical protein
MPATSLGGAAVAQPAVASGGLQNIPTRPSRSSGYGASTATTGTVLGSGAGGAGTGTVLGSGTVGAGTVAVTQNTPRTIGQNWPPERNLTREEHEIMIEVDRERNKNNPNYPPLPPTSLTPNPTPAPNPKPQ